VLFLLTELSAMVQKPSFTKQLSPLRFWDDFLFLRRSPSSSLLLELEVEYAEVFSSKEVSVVPWLFLFRCGKALEVFWVFGEFLDKIGLTGLSNWSDRFPLPA
jgi:hypothetical protein